MSLIQEHRHEPGRSIPIFGQVSGQWWAVCGACGSRIHKDDSPRAEWFATDGRDADDPPEYDPYDAAADQAEDHAEAQRELSAIEAEEAHDAAGEAWQAGAYPSGVTDPAATSGPRGV